MCDNNMNSSCICKKNVLEKHYTYEEIQAIANYLKDRVKITPQIGIICGSGLGSVAELLTDPLKFEYADLPNFPESTVIGHEGRLIFGKIDKISVICMQGRFHYYEGNSLSRCVMPVRLMKLLGVSTLIVSNAAGSVNPSYKAGDIMIIKDHLNLVGFAGNSPLRGPNDESFGPRFIALNNAYDQTIIKDAKILVEKLGLKGFHEGVYACVGGPSYETVAEMRALKILGCDAVGMSTVHEIITARHCGLGCFAFSLITNEGVMSYETEDKPDCDDILAVANQRKQDLKIFLKHLVPHLLNKQF
ncbi:purine nucleoside phosphorylase-like [Tribolium madens]|uniref:purine nucleoside phosphorylase-like n=1 Tax=Tribolium madens TaxID=41895 RepID=UPI001CF74AD2|nr:purine nucleoside phosphorylase-like [Tribolium madens]